MTIVFGSFLWQDTLSSGPRGAVCVLSTHKQPRERVITMTNKNNNKPAIIGDVTRRDLTAQVERKTGAVIIDLGKGKSDTERLLMADVTVRVPVPLPASRATCADVVDWLNADGKRAFEYAAEALKAYGKDACGVCAARVSMPKAEGYDRDTVARHERAAMHGKRATVCAVAAGTLARALTAVADRLNAWTWDK